MKREIFPLCVLSILVSCSPRQDGPPVEERIRNVENGLVEVDVTKPQEIFQAREVAATQTVSLSQRMEELGVPGLSLAVIEDFKIEWARAYGVMEAGTERPVTTETLFEAASTTKLLTSVVALHLVEQGLLELDEDVNRKLEAWKIPENEHTAGQKVTLRGLLTHQAGINRPDGGFGYEDGSLPTLIQVLTGEEPALNQAAAVEHVPGSKHQYSNMGYVVIQRLLEDVTDRAYPRIVSETLFEPLGMNSSTFTFPFEPDVAPRVARTHDQEGAAHDNFLHPTALAHGGLVTTPSDLARLVIELMESYRGRSERVLSQEMVQRMFRAVLELDPGEAVGSTGQGLGVFVIEDGESLYFSHPGYNTPGSICMLFASPKTGQGVVVMSNALGGWPLSLEITAAIAREYAWPTVRYETGS